MRHSCILVLLLLLGACASEPKKIENPENHLDVVISKGVTAQIFVHGTLNGEDRKFLLDTGAVRSALIPDDQTRALAITGHALFGGFGMKPRKCDWVHAQNFKIGGWKYADAPFTRCEDIGMGNVLGLDYLHHPTLELDFEHTSISMKGSTPKAGSGKMTEFKRNKLGLIEIPVKVANQDFWALFDTGCAMTLVDQAFVDAHPKAFHLMNQNDEPLSVPFKDSSGQVQQGKLYVANLIEIEGVPNSEQLVTVIPFPKDFKEKLHAPLILGANSIMTANWFFDLQKNTFRATGFSAKTPTLKDVQVTGDEVVRTSETTIEARGNAKISNDDNWLSGDTIVIDEVKKTARCEKDCIFAPGQNRIYVTPVVLDIVEKDWMMIEKTP